MIVIFYIILGWFVLGFLFKLLSPWLMRMVARHVQKNMERRMKDMFNTAADGAAEAYGTAGRTTRPPYPPAKTKKIDPEVGEYVHFEEVSTATEKGTTTPRPDIDYKVEEQVVDIDWEDLPGK